MNDLRMTARLDVEKDNVKNTLAYYAGINDGNLNAFDDVIAADVVDHATYADGHSPSLKTLLSALMGKMKIEIVRVLADGNFVATQVRKTFVGAPTARVEWNVLRFDNGKAVELWSAGQPEAAPNASGRTMLDGPVEVGDRAHTAANKALMQTFFADIIVGGDFSKVGAYYEGANLIQHDPHAGDGVQAITAYSMGLAQAGTPQIFNKAQLVIGEGDMVLVASDLTQGQQARSYWELYRLQNGKIAERWLVADDIPPATEWKNAYGKF